MRFILLIVLGGLIYIKSYAQDFNNYLQNNRFDLCEKNFDFPQKSFKILGFGAYHGSARTEECEIILLKSLSEAGQIKYYLPETDFSIAYFFNQYLQTGDQQLLKDLIKHYGRRVPQEKSVQVFEKWQKLRRINRQLPQAQQLQVVGIDAIVSYKYVIKHLLALAKPQIGERQSLSLLQKVLAKDSSDYSPYKDNYTKSLLKTLVNNYEADTSSWNVGIKDTFAFRHLIKNIKITFAKFKREETIFKNYKSLMTYYNFEKNPQFARFGVFHLEKEQQYRSPSFFTYLIQENLYPKEEIISVVAYLTKSKVLWDVFYDLQGNYKSYTTKAGFGIGDYWKEYFKGIKYLKKNALSDLTLFRLNQGYSPYQQGITDLIEIKLFLKKSNKDRLKNKTTTDFIDYALLIRNSRANEPIEIIE